jgi:hypothetical protein
MAFALTSPSVSSGDVIPTVHTCDGPGGSPPLATSTRQPKAYHWEQAAVESFPARRRRSSLA